MKTTVLTNRRHILIWIKAFRLKFLLAAPIPQVFIGASIAWHFKSIFDPLLFIIVMLGSVLAYLGCFGINEYFDYKSKADIFAQKDKTPFSGGSGTLPAGLLNSRDMLNCSIVVLGLGTFTAAYLTFLAGPILILFALIAIIGACSYTAPPMKLSYRGIGEFWTGLYCGPIMVLGTYYVFTKELAFAPILSAIPVGILVAAILWLNEILDYSADKQAGKETLVVKFGKKCAASTYCLFLVATYTLLMLNVIFKIASWISLFTLLTLPLAVKNAMIAYKYYDDSEKFLPAVVGHIKLHLIIATILTMSYFI